MRKDIIDLFRDSDAKLTEAPSPQAWTRLERRLNSRRPSVRRHARRVSLHRSLGMVAGLALVMGVIAGLVWLAERPGAVILAQQNQPIGLEDLAFQSTPEADFQVADIVLRHPVQSTNTITEGRPQQKLIVKGASPASPITPIDTTGELDPDRQETGR
jgi:hypothetical protein